ncbi:MAG: ABC transporter permease [Bdellovibrionota bacterium]
MRRLLSALALLLIVFAGTRALIRALPGDPLETLMAESGTSIPAAELRHELALDRPFLPAVLSDLRAFTRGDFGRSLFTRQPIRAEIQRRLSRTAELTLVSLLLALALAVPLGLAAAAAPGSAVDRACSWVGAVTAALPSPWLGPALLYLLAVLIPIFPVGGNVFLPALTLAIGFAGLWARLIRERVRDTLRASSADAARARGLPEWRVLVKYGLAPCSGALLAYLGTQAGALLGGAFVVEMIFSWKGLGSLLVESVLRRDYPLVEAGTFVASAAILAGNWAGDFAQRRMDPRLRESS